MVVLSGDVDVVGNYSEDSVRTSQGRMLAPWYDLLGGDVDVVGDDGEGGGSRAVHVALEGMVPHTARVMVLVHVALGHAFDQCYVLVRGPPRCRRSEDARHIDHGA